MKKIFLSVIILVFLATACKKDRRAPAEQGTPQDVTFKVGFEQSSVGFLETTPQNALTTNALQTNADTSLTNRVALIVYIVYAQDGTLLHAVKQKSTDPAFGKYTDNLQPGNYTVAIAAGPANLQLEGVTLATGKLKLDDYFDKETFFKKFTLTVGSTSTTSSVNLHRITSYLAVVIKDPIPQGANSVTVLIKGLAKKFSVASEQTIEPTSLYYKLDEYPFTPNGAPNYRIGVPILYTAPLTVNITVANRTSPTDASPVIYGQRQLTDVTGKPNTVTTLSGIMFGGTPSGNGFKLTVDTAWKAPINKSF